MSRESAVSPQWAIASLLERKADLDAKTERVMQELHSLITNSSMTDQHIASIEELRHGELARASSRIQHLVGMIETAKDTLASASADIKILHDTRQRVLAVLDLVEAIGLQQSSLERVSTAIEERNYDAAVADIVQFFAVKHRLAGVMESGDDDAVTTLNAKKTELLKAVRAEAAAARSAANFSKVLHLASLYAPLGAVSEGLTLAVDVTAVEHIMRRDAALLGNTKAGQTGGPTAATSVASEGAISKAIDEAVAAPVDSAKTVSLLGRVADTAFRITEDRINVFGNMGSGTEELSHSFTGPPLAPHAAVAALAAVVHRDFSTVAAELLQKVHQRRSTNPRTAVSTGSAPAAGRDLKTIDLVLEEVATLSAALTSYFEYMSEVARGEHHASERDGADGVASAPGSKKPGLEEFITKSSCFTAVQPLHGYFIGLTCDFLKLAIRATMPVQPDAHSEDTGEEALSDIFFLLRSSLRRAVRTASVNVMCPVLITIGEVLKDDVVMPFIAKANATSAPILEHLSRNISSNHPNTAGIVKMLRSLRPVASWINALQQVSSYVASLSKEATDLTAPYDADSRVEEVISPLTSGPSAIGRAVAAATGRWCHALAETVLNSVFYAPLDAFSAPAASYNITESQYVALDMSNPWPHNAVAAWSAISDVLLELFDESVVAELLSLIGGEIASSIEQIVSTKRFSNQGGLRIESDIRTLKRFWSSTCGKEKIRVPFLRLSNIGSLLAIDRLAEVRDLVGTGGAPSESRGWVLNAADIRATLKLRVDLPADQIDQMMSGFRSLRV